MPAVFLHGVPDTSRAWQGVVARLPRRDVVTLSLPGFGRPTPGLRALAARSAVNVGREWSGDLARITAPGLVLRGEGDPYVASRFDTRLAERTGCSHRWPLERPDSVASGLDRIWTHIRPEEPRDA